MAVRQLPQVHVCVCVYECVSACVISLCFRITKKRTETETKWFFFNEEDSYHSCGTDGLTSLALAVGTHTDFHTMLLLVTPPIPCCCRLWQLLLDSTPHPIQTFCQSPGVTPVRGPS